ncbi:hypothetical protein B0T22DRAFT_232945 [Podospora appendiculata]|uniref:Uncharacterized protein n=1 Tax=Podospora appendiculata TaxID=314037 RepID=A0AAE0X612_9PEZI|nr:hypothetical protein B0T22DRAFT_232945 [Podospora appendiculata]
MLRGRKGSVRRSRPRFLHCTCNVPNLKVSHDLFFIFLAIPCFLLSFSLRTGHLPSCCGPNWDLGGCRVTFLQAIMSLPPRGHCRATKQFHGFSRQIACRSRSANESRDERGRRRRQKSHISQHSQIALISGCLLGSNNTAPAVGIRVSNPAPHLPFLTLAWWGTPLHASPRAPEGYSTFVPRASTWKLSVFHFRLRYIPLLLH